MKIVIVAKNFSRFSRMIARLRSEQDVEMVPAATGAVGLALLQGKNTDLVIVDEQLDDMSGIEFVGRLVQVNPLVNTAIVGSLSDEDFHEATEGLGVLMQLPLQPAEGATEQLLSALARITGLLAPACDKAARL